MAGRRRSGVPRITPIPRACAPSRTGCSQSRSKTPFSGSQVDHTDSPTRMTVKWACAIRSQVLRPSGEWLVLVVVGRTEQDPIRVAEHLDLRYLLRSVLQVEIVEVRQQVPAIGVDAGDPDHRAGEAAGRLVATCTSHRSPARPARKSPSGPARRTAGCHGRSGRCRVASPESMATRSRSSSRFDPPRTSTMPIAFESQAFASVDPQVGEILVVVEDDQSGGVREVPRLDLDAGRHGGGEVLQLRGHQRDVEPGGEGVTAAQAQRAGPAPQGHPVSAERPPQRGEPPVDRGPSKSSRIDPCGTLLDVRRLRRRPGAGVSSCAQQCRRRPAASQPSSVHSTCCIAVSRPSIDCRCGSKGRAQRWATYHSPVGRVHQRAVSGLLQRCVPG